jgi:hypothetical protein
MSDRNKEHSEMELDSASAERAGREGNCRKLGIRCGLARSPIRESLPGSGLQRRLPGLRYLRMTCPSDSRKIPLCNSITCQRLRPARARPQRFFEDHRAPPSCRFLRVVGSPGRVAVSLPSCIPSLCAAKLIRSRIRLAKPLPSSRKSSTLQKPAPRRLAL